LLHGKTLAYPPLLPIIAFTKKNIVFEKQQQSFEMSIIWIILFNLSWFFVKCEIIERCDVKTKTSNENSMYNINGGRIKLKPIIHDGRPEAELINVQKIFFIEVRFLTFYVEIS